MNFRSLPILLEAQARNRVDHVAVSFGNQTLTYGALNNWSNQLAQRLRHQLVNPNEFVGLMMPRGVEMIVGILGILKSGAAYLPIDPAYPETRIRHMLAKTRCGLMVAHCRHPNVTRALESLEIIVLSDLGDESAADPVVSISAEDIAYVIFTSGSTGLPKGVIVEHKSLAGLRQAVAQIIPLGPKNKVLALANICFDISIFEILLALSHGAQVIVANEAQQRDPRALQEIILESGVDVLQFTPSQLHLFLDDPKGADALKNVKTVLVTGEALSVSTLNALQRCYHGRIYNLYGPTEATVWASAVELTRAREVTIGRPLINTKIHILSDDMTPVPQGTAGEIYIGGNGLARGYLDEPELTNKRFVVSPFDKSERLYRTGDLGILRSNGDIEYLGRNDFQLKIRGNRIEPQEIEAKLREHPAIRDAVVVGQRITEVDVRLVAYVVPRAVAPCEETEKQGEDVSGYRIVDYRRSEVRETCDLECALFFDNGKTVSARVCDISVWGMGLVLQNAAATVCGQATTVVFAHHSQSDVEVAGEIVWQTEARCGLRCCSVQPRDILGSRGKSTFSAQRRLADSLFDLTRNCLPPYMIPSEILFLSSLPMNSSGKVNRRALPDPQKARPDKDTTTYHSSVQMQLAHIWERLLNISNPPRDTSFFRLGGHSLTAMQLINEIERAFVRHISFPDLFANDTVEKLAALIERTTPTDESASREPPIVPSDTCAEYPLTAAQRRLYVLRQMDDTGTAYNSASAWRVDGELDYQRLRHALEQLAQCHEILRTAFVVQNEHIVQKVLAHIEVPLEFHQASSDSDLGTILAAFVRPFMLESPPLFRVMVIRLGPKDHVIVFDFHHIISDDTTIELLKRDLSELYKGRSVPKPRLQYRDYAVWENQTAQRPARECERNFWIKHLAGPLPVLEIPGDFQRPIRQSFQGADIVFVLDQKLWDQLASVAQAHGATPYLVLLAAFSTLLHRYSGQDDILVGTAIAGRRHPDVSDMVGVMVNTLVMRSHPTADMPFTELLSETKRRALLAFEHQGCEFDVLIGRLGITRSPNRGPLVDALFIMHESSASEWRLDDQCRLQPLEVPVKSARADLVLDVFERRDGSALCRLEYATSLYSSATAQRLTEHYVGILRCVGKNSSMRLNEISILTEAERALLARFNETRSGFMNHETAHGLFDIQAQRSPGRVAVSCNGESLTFDELRNRADELALQLRSAGAGRDCIVGIMLPRSLQLIVAQYAVLKSGAAYLPIDLDLPRSRIQSMWQKSKAEILLTSHQVAHESLLAAEKLFIDKRSEPNPEGLKLDNVNELSDLAYVLFTSGSTGQPNGVLIEHRSVVNFISGITQVIDFTPDDVIVSATTVSFDIFGLETLLALSQGTQLALATHDEQRDIRALARLITTCGGTMFQSTPSRYRLLLADPQGREALRALRVIMIGGESLPESLLKELQQLNPAMRIFNLYGPTETTIWSTLKDVTHAERVTIGKPIANTCVHIVNNDGSPQPIGVVGELCIGGAGLAREYLGDSRLTAQRFVNDHCCGHGRMYRTGDLARWCSDGELEFFGRRDNQVKIRGYRIELEEIQAAMTRVAGVVEATVCARGESDERFLVGYYVADNIIDAGAWRDSLCQSLPDYMLPSYYMQLDSLPLTPSGKLDGRALPDPLSDQSRSRPDKKPTAAGLGDAGSIETRLVEIWQSLLGRHDVSLNENFFDAGGDSFLLTRLHSLLEGEYPGAVNLGDLFALPTIKRQAAWLSSHLVCATLDMPRGIVLPREFYTDIRIRCNDLTSVDDLERRSLALHPEISRTLLENQIEKSSLDDLMLSVLFLYLARLSSPQVVVYFAGECHNGPPASINLNLDDIEDFGVLQDTIRTFHSKPPASITAPPMSAGGVTPVRPEIPILFGRDLGTFTPAQRLFTVSVRIAYEEDGLRIVCTFCRSLLRASTMSRFVTGYAESIRAVIKSTSTQE